MRIEQIVDTATRSSLGHMVDIREPGYTYDHGHHTAAIALCLADLHGTLTEPDVLHATALFQHIGIGSERHNQVGARLARELLEHESSAAEMDRISQIILEYPLRVRSNAHTLETRLVQDANTLDHIGQIRPWRTFYIGAGK
ncbi:MAG: hypothetical protein MUQ10_16720 [Anaerolineae bacterium]|nr:hypothetical protein [Anaerolineae bacterium]